MRLLPIVAFAALPVVAVAAATAGHANDVEVRSTIEKATVYPDGATVTRLIRVDLSRGETTLVVRDFPLMLDPSSLNCKFECISRQRRVTQTRPLRRRRRGNMPRHIGDRWGA